MSRNTLQIRIVTGDGLIHDQDWGTYEDLSEAEVREAAERFELAAVGTLLDFVHPEVLNLLLEDPEILEVLLEELVPCWQGRPLEPGTAYGVLLGGEAVKDFAQRTILSRLSAEVGTDRFLEARNGEFSAAPPQTAPAAPASAWKAPRGRLPENMQAKLRGRLKTSPKTEPNKTQGNTP
jgi:hypothetical protein